MATPTRTLRVLSRSKKRNTVDIEITTKDGGSRYEIWRFGLNCYLVSKRGGNRYQVADGGFVNCDCDGYKYTRKCRHLSAIRKLKVKGELQ